MSLLDFHKVLEKISQGFLVFDKDFYLIDANDKAMDLFAQFAKLEDIRGKHIFELSPTLEGSQRFEEYKEVMRTGKAYMTENFKYKGFGDKYFMLRAQKLSADHFAMLIQEIGDVEIAPKP